MILFFTSNSKISFSDTSGCLRWQLGTWPNKTMSESSSASNATQVFFPALSSLIVKFLSLFYKKRWYNLLILCFVMILKVYDYHVSYNTSITYGQGSNWFRDCHFKTVTWHPTIDWVVGRNDTLVITFFL